MQHLSANHRELFLPLVDGIHEDPPWGLFMRNLVALTNARRAFMTIALENRDLAQTPTVLHAAAPRAAHEPPLDFERILALGLYPYTALRPERVYGLDELLNYDDPAILRRQRDALHAMNINHGRWLRISARGAADASLFLVREREDFSARAGAALSALAPLMASALRGLAAIAEQRLRIALAENALARLGAGQLAFDAAGRVIAADALCRALLPFSSSPDPGVGQRMQLTPDAARLLEHACGSIASGASSEQLVLLDPHQSLWLLLRKADLVLPSPHAAPVAIGTLRIAGRGDADAAIRLIASVYGLSPREAALAHALTLGEPIIDAGLRLGLTAETARNYSKRIYAKTGARGQSDLVRILLNGLAPLC